MTFFIFFAAFTRTRIISADFCCRYPGLATPVCPFAVDIALARSLKEPFVELGAFICASAFCASARWTHQILPLLSQQPGVEVALASAFVAGRGRSCEQYRHESCQPKPQTWCRLPAYTPTAQFACPHEAKYLRADFRCYQDLSIHCWSILDKVTYRSISRDVVSENVFSRCEYTSCAI